MAPSSTLFAKTTRSSVVELVGVADRVIAPVVALTARMLAVLPHRNIETVGDYRKHKEPMQIASGRFDGPARK